MNKMQQTMNQEIKVRNIEPYGFNKRYTAPANQAVHGAFFGKKIYFWAHDW